MNSKTLKAQGKNFQPVRPGKAYVPDVSAFMSLCDANYAKLMQLLPELDSEDKRDFALSKSSQGLGDIRISVLERSPYTSTLDIVHHNPPGLRADIFVPTSMHVRLYHDARMAEVLSYQGHEKLRESYQFPNKAMLEVDEKALCNEFLADWLSYCLKFGRSEKVFTPEEY